MSGSSGSFAVVRALDAAAADQRLSDGGFRELFSMLRRRNGVWARGKTNDTRAKECGKSTRTITNRLAELNRLGYIKTKHLGNGLAAAHFLCCLEEHLANEAESDSQDPASPNTDPSSKGKGLPLSPEREEDPYPLNCNPNQDDAASDEAESLRSLSPLSDPIRRLFAAGRIKPIHSLLYSPDERITPEAAVLAHRYLVNVEQVQPYEVPGFERTVESFVLSGRLHEDEVRAALLGDIKKRVRQGRHPGNAYVFEPAQFERQIFDDFYGGEASDA